jgi:hypothetical protein
MEYMPQFETQVPDPLREDLPKLLTPGGMRAPAIRILLLIFITEYALERSPVLDARATTSAGVNALCGKAV